MLGVTGGADVVRGGDDGRREADGVVTGVSCVTDVGEHVGGRAVSGSITPASGVGVTQGSDGDGDGLVVASVLGVGVGLGRSRDGLGVTGTITTGREGSAGLGGRITDEVSLLSSRSSCGVGDAR